MRRPAGIVILALGTLLVAWALCGGPLAAMCIGVTALVSAYMLLRERAPAASGSMDAINDALIQRKNLRLIHSDGRPCDVRDHRRRIRQASAR